jgi:disulfide bond formation protein DsbB
LPKPPGDGPEAGAGGGGGPGAGAGGLLRRIAGLPDRLFDDFWGTLKLWQDGRALWLCGGLSALSLELFSVLYFQGRLRLSPCEYCVLIRLSMLVVFLGGMTGAVLPRSLPFKVAGLAVSLAGAVAGLRWTVVLENINLSSMDPDYLPPCSPGGVASFPFGIPLDRWLPGHFRPGGLCGESSLAWTFMDMTMTQWLIMVYAVYIAGLSLMAVAAALPRRDPGPGGAA